MLGISQLRCSGHGAVETYVMVGGQHVIYGFMFLRDADSTAQFVFLCPKLADEGPVCPLGCFLGGDGAGLRALGRVPVALARACAAGAGGWPPRPARKGLLPAQWRLRSVCGGIVSGLQAYAAHRLCCGFALHSWHFCSCLGPSRPVTLGCTWVRPSSQCLLGAGPSHSCKPCALEPQASVCTSWGR